jgi:hypothetical protein
LECDAAKNINFQEKLQTTQTCGTLFLYGGPIGAKQINSIVPKKI